MSPAYRSSIRSSVLNHSSWHIRYRNRCILDRTANQWVWYFGEDSFPWLPIPSFPYARRIGSIILWFLCPWGAWGSDKHHSTYLTQYSNGIRYLSRPAPCTKYILISACPQLQPAWELRAWAEQRTVVLSQCSHMYSQLFNQSCWDEQALVWIIEFDTQLVCRITILLSIRPRISENNGN